MTTNPLSTVKEALDELLIAYGMANVAAGIDPETSPVFQRATEALTALQEYERVSGWQDMDSAPSFSNVIVFCDGIVGEARNKHDPAHPDMYPNPSWWWANLDSEYGEEIHPKKWQYLPQPPKQGE